MRFVRAWVLASASLVAACASSPSPQSPASTAPRVAQVHSEAPDLSSYKLGIGDRVRIEVYGENDLSLDATVDPGGRINYPLLGSIVATRKTAKDLQDDLTARLAAGYLRNPDVRVIVIGYRAFYAVGQVKRPGSYGYVIGLTVEKAIALAGGLTNIASTSKIYVLREDQPVDKRIKAELDTEVFPGDTLMVEEGLF
jgi:protein involved in polysaccharide export with SLBB domain